MESGLQKVNPVLAHQVYDPVRLGNTPRPDISTYVFEWFRLPYSRERVWQYCLRQIKDT